MLRADLSLFPDYRPGKNTSTGLKLSANEVTQPPLPTVLAAMSTAALNINRYPKPGSPRLTQALSKMLELPADHIAVAPGSSAIVQQAAMMTCQAGDEMLFPWRSFEAYPLYARVAGATPVTVPLTADHRLDLPAVAAAITDKTKLIVLCNPNNPTGTTITKDEFTAFMGSIPRNVVVLLDEAYFEYCTDMDTPNATEEVKKYPNLIGTRTFSKAYGLAGLRVGYGFGNPELIRALNLLALPLTVTDLGEEAALASLDARDELLDRVEESKVQRDRVVRALGAVPSHTNFVYLPCENNAEIEAALFQRGVVIRAWSDSGVRVTITNEEETTQFLAAWEAAELPMATASAA